MNLEFLNLPPQTGSAILLALADAAIKSVALLALAAMVSPALRKTSAATRHALWFGALAGALLLPVFSYSLPEWRVPWLPEWKVEVVKAERPRTATPNAQPSTLNAQITPASLTLSDPPPMASFEVNAPSPVMKVDSLASLQHETQNSKLETYLFPLWLIGAFFSVLPLIAGWWQAARLTRQGRPLAGPEWGALLEEVANVLPLRRRVRLLAATGSVMPFTWGDWRPVVIFPEEAEGWSRSRRRLVLLHELGHVKRRDWLTQTLGSLACAIYWFNPLAWLAARQLRLEREQACDDLVLACGEQPRDYARELLEIAAASARSRVLNWVAVPVARPGKLETRLRAILDGTRNRRTLTRVALLGLLTLVAAIVIPMAMLRGAQADTSPAGKSGEITFINPDGSGSDYHAAIQSTGEVTSSPAATRFAPKTTESGAAVHLLVPVETPPAAAPVKSILQNGEQAQLVWYPYNPALAGLPNAATLVALAKDAANANPTPLVKKLKSISIPSVNIDVATPLDQVAATLHDLSMRFDPEGTGVNFVVYNAASDAPLPKVKLAGLSNLTLEQLLDIVCGQAGFYYREENGVIALRTIHTGASLSFGGKAPLGPPAPVQLLNPDISAFVIRSPSGASAPVTLPSAATLATSSGGPPSAPAAAPRRSQIRAEAVIVEMPADWKLDLRGLHNFDAIFAQARDNAQVRILENPYSIMWDGVASEINLPEISPAYKYRLPIILGPRLQMKLLASKHAEGVRYTATISIIPNPDSKGAQPAERIDKTVEGVASDEGPFLVDLGRAPGDKRKYVAALMFTAIKQDSSTAQLPPPAQPAPLALPGARGLTVTAPDVSEMINIIIPLKNADAAVVEKQMKALIAGKLFYLRANEQDHTPGVTCSADIGTNSLVVATKREYVELVRSQVAFLDIAPVKNPGDAELTPALKKLQGITIHSINIHAPLGEVASLLHVLSARSDPAGEGVEFKVYDIGPTVEAPSVTLENSSDATLGQIIDSLCRQAGYVYHDENGVIALRYDPMSDTVKREKNLADQQVAEAMTLVYQLKNAKAADVVSQLNATYNAMMKARSPSQPQDNPPLIPPVYLADERTNTLIATVDKRSSNQLSREIAALDPPVQFRVKVTFFEMPDYYNLRTDDSKSTYPYPRTEQTVDINVDKTDAAKLKILPEVKVLSESTLIVSSGAETTAYSSGISEPQSDGFTPYPTGKALTIKNLDFRFPDQIQCRLEVGTAPHLSPSGVLVKGDVTSMIGGGYGNWNGAQIIDFGLTENAHRRIVAVMYLTALNHPPPQQVPH